MMKQGQNKVWLFSSKIDLLALILPVILTWIICFSLSDEVLNAELPLWAWVVIVIGIDVSHVWSTLFRTYLDNDERHNHQKILIKAPLISFSICFVVALYSINLFWTILAYYALYHFIKQQYGFMQIYRSKYGRVDLHQWISDKTVIYIAMGYPVLFWHLNLDRAFDWFEAGDFFRFELTSQFLAYFNPFSQAIYFLLIAIWLGQELYNYNKYHLKSPIGKWTWILMTAFNWYLGIVFFNSDIAFTLTNVVAHGIPYFVLIGYYVIQKNKISSSKFLNTSHKYWIIKYVVWMVSILLVLSIGEEYLWDMLLYHDNVDFFTSLFNYPMSLLQAPWQQALALALLSLPQVTHYILDGYIWKSNTHNPYLKQVLMD